MSIKLILSTSRNPNHIIHYRLYIKYKVEDKYTFECFFKHIKRNKGSHGHVIVDMIHSLTSRFYRNSYNTYRGEGGSMGQVVGLPNNSYKPFINTTQVRARLCKLQNRCTRLAASDKVYQLLAHGRWFSPVSPASFTTKTGRHDIAEILLKVTLSTINQSINLTHIQTMYVHCRKISNLFIRALETGIAASVHKVNNFQQCLQIVFIRQCQEAPTTIAKFPYNLITLQLQPQYMHIFFILRLSYFC